MSVKLTELQRLDVRAKDLCATAASLASDKLTAAFVETTEMVVAIQTLLGNLGEEEQKEHGEFAKTVAANVAEARALVTNLVDAKFAKNQPDLNRRVQDALDPAGDPTPAPAGTPPNAQVEALTKTNTRLRELLREAQAAGDFYQQRFEEASEVLESSEDALQQRYAAAKKVSAELLSRLQETESALEELAEEHETLNTRYDAAVRLVAGVKERQDESKIVRRVREAIEVHPDLRRFSKSLLACETIEELEERLREYGEALGLPMQAKAEAMVEGVNLSGLAKSEDEEEATAETDDVDNTRLPSHGSDDEDGEIIDEDVDEVEAITETSDDNDNSGSIARLAKSVLAHIPNAS